MKNFNKYLIAGAMMIGLSSPAMAQDVDYKTMLVPVVSAIKSDYASVEAVKGAKEYIKTFKKNPEALVALGNTYLSEKLFDKAVECADLALKRNPNYGNAFILKGDVEALKDDGGAAANWYDRAISAEPQNAEGYLRYANVFRKVNPQESERVLNDLRRIMPNFPVEAELGHSNYLTKNYDKALEFFQKAKKESIDEEKFVEYVFTANILGNKKLSLDVAKQGVNIHPNSLALTRLAVINAIDLGENADALKYAQMVFNDDGKKNATDYINYGRALNGNAQYDEAIKQFETALKEDAEKVEAYRYMSDSYKGKDDMSKSLDLMQKYLNLNNEAKPSDYNSLAAIYMEMVKDGIDKETNFKKAMSVFDDVANKYPQIAAWAYLQKGNNAYTAEYDDIAVENYDKVISLLENKADRDESETAYLKRAYKIAGYTFWAGRDDFEKAKVYLNKLYELDPNDPVAKQAYEAQQETTEATE